ncbi:hypothetical protein SLA_2359 [Streptomyces laurentii]|uniref:Secreted protein n=1 Tax=Streptomyces laurentii TaxID=39478 RepID=A0A160NWY4_STRLU|nr:hypothetical protein SLA_2359 [Streptomyces laurentii]
MTYPPNAPAASAARGTSGAPAQPGVQVPAQPGPPPQPGRTPDAVTAAGAHETPGLWRQGRATLRRAATTEPGRLRILGTVLALLVLAFGAVTASEVAYRSSYADDVVDRSQPLSADAADIYRSLADADATAASAFLAGPQESADIRKRYTDDIATASRLLVKASASTGSDGTSAREITTLNENLPRYTGLIERARAANRQGLPLGGAYLRYANQTMSLQLLPAAERLYAAETARLQQDDDAARTWPFLSIALGAMALTVLFRAQRRDYRRTNRVFNQGLLAASAACVAAVVWLVVGHGLARAGLDDARAHGQESLQVLNQARIHSLKARANENLAVVARGAVLTEDGKTDKYEADYAGSMAALTSDLKDAARLADDATGADPLTEATKRTAEWRERHTRARKLDDEGDFTGAMNLITGTALSTGQSFDQVDAALGRALAHEQNEFTRAADGGRDALTGLPLGVAALGVLAAAGVVVGGNRRLSEYR